MPVTPGQTGYAGQSSNLASGTDPLSGNAKDTVGSQLPIIYDNPFLAIQKAFPNINLAGPYYQSLRDIGADPLVLYMAMQGNRTKAAGDQGAEAFYNWLVDLYRAIGTPGGRWFNAQEMIRNIFNARTGDQDLSPLGAMLLAGDQSTQMRTLFNLLRDVTNVGMNPLAARAYQAALARAGDRALYQILTGTAPDQPVFQLIRQIMPALVA